jgi:hypothetical protein
MLNLDKKQEQKAQAKTSFCTTIAIYLIKNSFK